ncbi:MAG: N-acetylmuramoyl-L-alanine amidase [Croceitalea sp.]|nr:N-acetylmuramoyl-L-alanine amidase [Croceitalea sp.]
MKTLISCIFTLCFFITLCSQDDQIKVKVENGDGIYSLLRKHGLNPSEHYAAFMRLNKNNIKNGSELYLDRQYILPRGATKEKQISTSILNLKQVHNTIKNNQLKEISPKSDRLKNAIIYLLAVDRLRATIGSEILTHEILLTVAEQLMLDGAEVYIFNKNEPNQLVKTEHGESIDDETEVAMGRINQMSSYVDVINKTYLKNQGKYQRILAINLCEEVENSNYFDISIYHHDRSEIGKRFAKNIQQIFKQNSIAKETISYTEVFKNTNNLYLANNTLPAITLIDINHSNSSRLEERLSIKSDRYSITGLITNGVLNDYSNVILEN